jgi:hypothetical protein
LFSLEVRFSHENKEKIINKMEIDIEGLAFFMLLGFLQ